MATSALIALFKVRKREELVIMPARRGRKLLRVMHESSNNCMALEEEISDDKPREAGVSIPLKLAPCHISILYVKHTLDQILGTHARKTVMRAAHTGKEAWYNAQSTAHLICVSVSNIRLLLRLHDHKQPTRYQ